jgi:membrane protein YqaA with SNARE-associated domain
VRSLSAWIIGLVASPSGIVVLALLDSTILFSLPGGIDAAVVVVAARRHTSFWAVGLLATAGSLAGAALTFWMGIKIGEHGLQHYIRPKRLERIRRRIGDVGAIKLAILDLIPPPFPFTPFILAAGAVGIHVRTFFWTLAACRLLRFGGEALLAVIYGQRLLELFDSDTFRNIVAGCSVLALVLTIVSIVKIFEASRSRGRTASAR